MKSKTSCCCRGRESRKQIALLLAGLALYTQVGFSSCNSQSLPAQLYNKNVWMIRKQTWTQANTRKCIFSSRRPSRCIIVASAAEGCYSGGSREGEGRWNSSSLLSRVSFTTNQGSCYIPPARTNYGKLNIRFNGAIIWNNVDESFKRLSLFRFKREIKNSRIATY